MADANLTQATVLAAVVLANIAGILGAYVSLKVAVAKLEVKYDKNEVDLKNLGEMIKNLRLKGE